MLILCFIDTAKQISFFSALSLLEEHCCCAKTESTGGGEEDLHMEKGGS